MVFSGVSYENIGFDAPGKRNGMQNCNDIDPASYAITRMNNRQLLELAKRQPVAEYKNKERNTTLGLFVGVPLLASIVDAIKVSGADMGKAALSQKTGVFFKTLGWWGAALTFLGGYMGVNNALTKGSDTLTNLKKEHPIVKFALDLGGAFLALSGASWIGKKAINLTKEEFPNMAKNMKENFASIGKSIDKSSIAKKIFEPAQNALIKYAEKHPKIAASSGAAGVVLCYAVIGSIVALLMKKVFDSSELKKQVQDNYLELKEYQKQYKDYCEAEC